MKARVIISFAFAALLYAFFLAEEFTDAGGLWFAVLLFPFSVGFSSQVLIDPEVKLLKRTVFGGSLGVMLFLLVVLIGIGLESLICAVIALPITLLLQFFGILVARDILRPFGDKGSTTLRSSLLVIPLGLMMLNPNPPLPQRDFVATNVITIDAPAARVWREIEAFAQVKDSERLWTVSHNLLGAPVPMHSAIQGDIRHAVWSQDVVYDEVLTTRDAGHMAWDIRFAGAFRTHDRFQRILPNSEQFTLLRGRYDLDERDGVTKLTLRTEYRLQTAMNLYVAWWGRLFLSDNHSSILHVLKLRSEAGL